MSRTTLCAVTAAVLVLLSVTVMVVRQQVLGDELRRPRGPGAWKVTLAVHGTSLGNARVITAMPLDLERQQVYNDAYQSEQLFNKAPQARHPERRSVIWSQRGGAPDGPFRARCEFHVAVEVGRPNALMTHTTTGLYAAPRPGEYLSENGMDTDHEIVSATARRLLADLETPPNPQDVAETLYRFVADDIKNDPSDGPSATAAECLKNQRGDRLAQSRLLLALLRNRGIASRIVTGVALSKGSEQRPHYWVEAWLSSYGRWLPMCPFYRHFGRVPATYLIFGFGEKPLVRGRHVKDLDFAFLVERLPAPDPNAADISPMKRLFMNLSLFALPPAERRLVEILLLLPIAALIICIFRNIIGLSSFGSFAPALIGLAFHDLHSLPGILVFVTILLIGWMMRRVLDHYHLLQVPRIATMLTLIMIVLISAVVAANVYGAPTTRYISLFPMVILCGMVERFWTLETEDSTSASFRTLFQTMFISTVIALVLSRGSIAQHMFRFPETLGLNVTLSSESDAIEFLVNEEGADPDATVSGALFLGSTAHPLGNVALTLTPSTGSSVYTATTWYDGRFAVPDVAAGTYSISAEGYLPDPVGTVTVASTKHGLTLIADAGATLTGTVTLPDGQTPVPGAVVSATVGSTTLSSAPSATDGSYTISGLPTGQAAVFAAAPGYEPANGLTAAVTQGQSATLAVQMAQAGSITGVVSSPGGSPDSSAQVDAELATGGPVITGAVSSDGSYAIADLGPGTYNVVAEDSGDGPAEQQGVAVVAGAASGGVGLQLTSTPATVHGVVTDSDSGDPVSGATVATDAANGGEGPVTTASDGSYTLDGLPAGATQISVTPPDGGYLEGTATATAIAGSTMTQNISLTPSGTLSASIDEGDGTTALADAAVEVVGPTPGTSGAPEQTQAFTTDGFGNLTVNDLPTGAYDLQVVGSDTDQAFAVGTGNRSPTVSLTVPTGVVDGTIDSSSGSPAPGVQVFIADPDGAIDTTTTDSNGHYSFLVTADESLSVVASDPSVGELSESGVAAATGTTTTAPTLRAGTASLAVTVTAGGSPADDASVTLSLGAAKDQPAALAATTNGSGVATLDNLTPGTYDLEASDGSHATSQQQVTVASGSHSLPVPLAAPGTIAGTVTDTSSSPLSGVDITADASSGLTERVKSGKNGGYSFSNLPPDTYIVTASAAAGDAPTSASGVAVTAGTTTTQNLALPTTGSTLTVSLSASVGAPLPQTSLALEDSHGVTVASGEVGGAEQPSDSTAQTSFGPLSDGAYTVVATAPGRATVTQDVTVSGGTTASVTAPAGEAVPTVTSTTGPTGATRSLVRALHSAAGPATPAYWSAVQFFAKNWSTLIPNPSPDAFITYNAVKSNFANIAANWTGKCVNPYIAKAQAYLDAANAQLQRWQGDYNYLQEQTFVSELTLAGDAANAIGAVILVGVAAIPLIPAAAAIASTAGPEFGAALVALGGAQIVNQLIQGLSTFDFSQTLTQLNNAFSSVTGYLETFEAAGAVTPAFVKWGGKASALLNSILAAKSTLDDLVSAMQHLQNTVADAAASQKNFTYFLGVARSATLAIPFYQCPPNPPKNPPPPTPKPQPPYPNKSPSNYNDHDPNAIFGSLGDGSAAHYVRPSTPLSYTVTFENDGDAAVTEVFVTMPLPKGVAPGSVDLTGFGFGHTSVPLTATTAFSTTLTNLGLANGDDVTAAGEYDAPTKTVRWSIEAIDPSTGDVDSSPSGGFLPTDNSADDGEGYVDVSLAPSSGLATGTAIRAHASIVFDRNAAISTPTWTNTIESSGPAATVRALPRAEHKAFTVHWSGTTHGSAIASYDIYVSNNNGNYLRWRHASKAGSATYRGKEFHRYSFIAIATDKLGNVQAFPVKAQATSIIGTPPKVLGISPARGPHGTRVIIRGSGFMKVTRVTFGARKSSYRVRSAHEIVARVPRGHGKVRITVTTVIGSATESRRFVYAASGSRRATQHRRAHLLHPRRSSRAPRAVAPDSVSLLDASRAATGW